MKSFQEWLSLKFEAKKEDGNKKVNKLKKVKSRGFNFPKPYCIGTTPDEDDQGGEMDDKDAEENNEPGQDN